MSELKMEQILTLAKVALILDMKPRDVRHLVREGKIPAKQRIVHGTGKMPRIVFLQSAIERYIEELPDVMEPPRYARTPRKARRANAPTEVHDYC